MTKKSQEDEKGEVEDEKEESDAGFAMAKVVK
jgi:hypothetical protein